MSDVATTGVRTLRAEDADAVRAIQEASLATDDIPGFVAADIERAMIRVVADPEGTLVAVEDGVVVGYCTPNHDDLTVRPAARRRGHGRRLVEATAGHLAARGIDELVLYVPSHLPGSEAFARAVGLHYRSSLWQFELAAEHPVPAPAFPDDVLVRTWDPARDVDLEAWTAFMLAAFEGHPTRMSWTPAVIRAVNAAPDFDPRNVCIVAATDAPDRPIAFGVVGAYEEAGERIGDVRLIGVLPAWRRRGLGRELLRWAVATVRAGGARKAELSVEAANERATALYRAHGFEPAIEWPHWVLAAR